jgi:hypothetical protein
MLLIVKKIREYWIVNRGCGMKKSDLVRVKLLISKIEKLEDVISNFIIGGPESLDEFVNFIAEQRRFDNFFVFRGVELTEQILTLIKKQIIKQKEALEKELTDLGVIDD